METGCRHPCSLTLERKAIVISPLAGGGAGGMDFDYRNYYTALLLYNFLLLQIALLVLLLLCVLLVISYCSICFISLFDVSWLEAAQAAWNLIPMYMYMYIMCIYIYICTSIHMYY